VFLVRTILAPHVETNLVWCADARNSINHIWRNWDF